MPEPIYTDEQVEEMRREWFLNVITSFGEARERTEAGESTADEWDGEIADPIHESTPDRRPRPRGSYNRGLCIVRRRRAQASCARRCPCRTTYPAPQGEAESSDRVAGVSEGGHEPSGDATEGGPAHVLNVRPEPEPVNEPIWTWAAFEAAHERNLDIDTDRG